MLCSLNSIEKLMIYAAGSNNQKLRSKVKMQRVLFLVSEAIPKVFGEELRFEPIRTDSTRRPSTIILMFYRMRA